MTPDTSTICQLNVICVLSSDKVAWIVLTFLLSLRPPQQMQPSQLPQIYLPLLLQQLLGLLILLQPCWQQQLQPANRTIFSCIVTGASSDSDFLSHKSEADKL